MHLKIVRLSSDGIGTIGMLLANDRLFASTLENPWKSNENNISCIPTGVYKARKYTSKKHGKTLIIEGVPNRTGVLFHVGNWAHDTEGCVLLGDGFKKTGQCMITNSTSAMLRFKEMISSETQFSVEVVNASGM